MIIKIFTIIFLIMESIEDWRYRTISLQRLIIWGILAVVIRCMIDNMPLLDMILAIVFGVVVLFMCKISNEAMGYGDGVVILILAIVCGVKQTMVLWSLAFVVFVLAAGGVVIKQRRFSNISLPFVPCILVGYLGGIIL